MGFLQQFAAFEQSYCTRVAEEAAYLLPDAGPLTIDQIAQSQPLSVEFRLAICTLTLPGKSSLADIEQHAGERDEVMSSRLLGLLASVTHRAPWRACQVLLLKLL